jgi:preprotein translocase subunit SecG
MTTFLVVMHILFCFFLIGVVLLQPGSRGGMGGAFGGGGATVFGGRGANTLLAKLTAGAAIMFMLTSISLSYFASKSTSVFADEPSVPKADPAAVDVKPAEIPAPAAPVTP